MRESITLARLLLRALSRVDLQAIFDSDAYESRRRAMPGSRLVKILVLYQMIRSEKMRGLIRVIDQHAGVQAALGGKVARNTLSNALAQRDLDQMIEAWMKLLETYRPWISRMGKKFARLALVDASMIKLSFAVYGWAEFQQQSAAAKMTAILEWSRAIPQQFVMSCGKVHDLKAATELNWVKDWTYVFDRGYLGFHFLAAVLEAGAHFVVRFKAGINYHITYCFTLPKEPTADGIRLLSDQAISLPGWGGIILRLVSYQLPDGKVIQVLTDRFDLSALSVAQIYKHRWEIELYWKWIKQMFKIKRPLGESENAMAIQIVSAYVTDLLLRAFKHSSAFTGSLYEFVESCKNLALVPLEQLTDSVWRQALEVIHCLLAGSRSRVQPIT